MAPSGKLRDSRQIWEPMVDFVNTDLTQGDMAAHVQSFLALRHACLRQIDPNYPEHLRSRDQTPSAKALVKYQRNLWTVFMYVSRPWDVEEDVADEGVAFVWDDLPKIEWSRPSIIAGFPARYPSFVSPISLFISREMSRAVTGDEEELQMLVPVNLCERPECGRFRVFKTLRKPFFCSNLCKAKFHQNSKTKEEKRDYMRSYRANPKS